MARSGAFTTKELSNRTWPDYVRFFSQGNGWDHCGCTFAQGFRAPKEVRKWAVSVVPPRDAPMSTRIDIRPGSS